MTVTKTKVIIALLVTFFLGMALAPESASEVQTETKIVEVSNLNEWRQLKQIDDRGFNLCADGMNTASKAMSAVINGDLQGLTDANEELLNINTEVNKTANERQLILLELGY